MVKKESKKKRINKNGSKIFYRLNVLQATFLSLKFLATVLASSSYDSIISNRKLYLLNISRFCNYM